MSRPLRRDHFVLALPAGHARAGETVLEITDLRHDPWVWLRREISPGYHDELVAACRQAGFSPDTRHHANSITSQLAMVACGLGVTLVPHTSARPDPRIMYLPPRHRVDLVELSLVHRAGPPDRLVDHFIHCTTAPDGVQ